MRECDEEPNNTTGLVNHHPIPAVGSPETLLAPGAFPSLIVNRIALAAPHRNDILITDAPRHRRGGARLEGTFNSAPLRGAMALGAQIIMPKS